METTPDRPSAMDLDRLEHAVTAEPFQVSELARALAQVAQALKRHGRDVDRAGGLLAEQDRVARPSLDRQAEAVRQSASNLTQLAEDLTQQANSAARAGNDGGELRQQAREFVSALQQLRDAEADVALESAETDIGAGD